MSSETASARPHLDIARLPGEQLLEGVPHKRSESLFAEIGVVDALELVYATIDKNSRQRRGPQEAVLRDFDNRRIELSDVVTGLDTVSQHSASPDLSRHARFMGSLIAAKAERLAAEKRDKTTCAPKSRAEQIYRAPFERINATMRDKVTSIGSAEFVAGITPEADTDLKAVVNRLVRAQDAEDPEIIEAGMRLFYRYNNPENTFTDSLTLFAELALAIDHAKIKSVGRKAPTTISNQIIAAAGVALVDSHPDSYGKQSAIDSYLGLLEQKMPDIFGWFVPKLRIINQHYGEKSQLLWYFDRFMNSNEAWRLETSLSGHEAELRSLADETMQELHEFRSYGLKPAYTTNGGETLSSDESWVIEDPAIYARGAKTAIPRIANFIIADTDSPDSLETEEVVEKYTNGGEAAHLKRSFSRKLTIGMFADGELAIGSGYNLSSFRKDFEARGLSSTYEYLRLTLIRQLFDLTVPAGFVAGLPGTPEPKRRWFGRQQNHLTEITDLMVPRLKVLREEKTAIHAALDEENNEHIGNRRQHEVAGHRVSLPAGYKPSQDALMLARQDGVTLRPGETYRKKHKRGNPELGIISGNHAIQR